VLIACPGRLLDLMNQGYIDLSHVKYFVCDEADRLLDMGFKDDIDRIIEHLPEKRHNSLFSATFEKGIQRLGLKMLSKDPV